MKLIERSRGQAGFKLWLFYLLGTVYQLLDTFIPVITLGKYTGHFAVWWFYYSKLGEKLEGEEK